MGVAKITRSEIPQPPAGMVERLREFDSRLDLVFNTNFCVWEVREFLARKGVWNHVFFWHEGPWNQMEFKPLPHTAEPLLAKLGSIDWARHGLNPKQKLDQLRAEGASERAAQLEKAKSVGAQKFRAYDKWFRKNWPKLIRRFMMGGRARSDAIAERNEAYTEILKDGKG